MFVYYLPSFLSSSEPDFFLHHSEYHMTFPNRRVFHRDVANVVRATYGEVPPPIILVGHSMGGAIAVHAASGSLLPSVVGLVVIDVVEGEPRLCNYDTVRYIYTPLHSMFFFV